MTNMTYMTRYIKTVDGFGILFESEPECISPRQHFIKECGWTESQYQKIKNYEWFSARVSAWKNGEELASTYLGACCYKTVEEFYTTYHDDYFADMVREVIVEAKRVERDRTAKQTNA